MSLDQPQKANLTEMYYCFFGSIGGFQLLHYAYGDGQKLLTTVQTNGMGIEKGLLVKHIVGVFQNSGNTMRVQISYNGVVVPAATLIIATGIFLDVEVAEDIGFEVNAPIKIGGDVFFTVVPPGGAIMIFDNSLISDVRIG